MQELFARWLYLLGQSLGASVHHLEPHGRAACLQGSLRKGQTVALVPDRVCAACPGCGCNPAAPLLLFKLEGEHFVLSFNEATRSRDMAAVTGLLELTCRLALQLEESLQERDELQLLRHALFYLGSHYLNNFCLIGPDQSLRHSPGRLDERFFRMLDEQRRAGGEDRGSLERDGHDFQYRVFTCGGKDLAVYWQMSEQPSPTGEAQPAHYSATASLIGRNATFVEALELARKAARSENTVLLLGESGTGKELFARAIHQMSPRKNRPFVAVNCAAIPENLLESELFGYEEGSFTGAKKGGKVGKFQLADGGTFFLDEIGDMPLALQAKLLRVIQEKRVERLGGISSTPVNVRLIAATHNNLEELVRRDLFRRDLYFRLNVIPVLLPPLRERKDDIEILLTYYLKKHCLMQNRPFCTFSSEALEFLKDYHWPGNIRQLDNVVAYAVSVCNEDFIQLSHLPPYLSQGDGQVTDKQPGRRRKCPTARELADLLERYGHTTYAKKEMAAALGVSLATLYRWLQRYGLK